MAPLGLQLRIAQGPHSHQAPVEPAPQAQSARGGGNFILSRPYEALPPSQLSPIIRVVTASVAQGQKRLECLFASTDQRLIRGVTGGRQGRAVQPGDVIAQR
ncbi:hypothetical protein NVIRENTERO_02209 [Sodalis praecaptivus]|nr:hypothetical protein NVIRENTERO_02209 [Sodalis praecaptivus]